MPTAVLLPPQEKSYQQFILIPASIHILFQLHEVHRTVVLLKDLQCCVFDQEH